MADTRIEITTIPTAIVELCNGEEFHAWKDAETGLYYSTVTGETAYSTLVQLWAAVRLILNNLDNVDAFGKP